MGKRYDAHTYNEAKRLFVEEEKSPREISLAFSGRPSWQTVQKWTHDLDSEGRDWKELREEFRNTNYENISPQQQAKKILEKINEILHNEDKWDVKHADALSKLQKTFEKIVDVKYQIPVMFQLLTDLLKYLKKYYPEFVTEDFLSAIRDFKNYLRGRID